MACDLNYVMKYLKEMEEIAEEVLESRERIVYLDCQRNKVREALRVLSKANEMPGESKSWMCFGNMFIKTKNSNIKHILEKDQERVNKHLTKIHADLKPKVKKLKEMEGKTLNKGFDLKPLNKEEIAAIRSQSIIS